MNIKCFLVGHLKHRMMAFDDQGLRIARVSEAGQVVPYLPVNFCSRCGKVSGFGNLQIGAKL